jgi:hypothetical protein
MTFDRRLILILCGILLTGVCLSRAFAAPILTIESPQKKISLGQRAILKIKLEWPQAEGPYEINSLEPKPENLTLEAQNQSQSISISENSKLGQPRETGAMVRHTITYEFLPIKKGTAKVYPFEVSYRKSETDPWTPVFIPEQNTQVVSSFPLKAFWIGFAVLGTLLGAGFTGFKLWQTAAVREAAKDLPPPDPRQRLYAKAEEAISTFSSPDAKEKLTYWANQLRPVIVSYYNMPSKTATSAEILSLLKSQGIPAGEWQEISRIFEQLAEMQFSRQDIPSYDLDRMQKTLLQYVKGKIIIGNSYA